MSRTVPRPITWEAGSPSSLIARYVRTSTGFDTTKINASFRNPLDLSSLRIPRNRTTLRLIRSSRLSSGLRLSPAVMTMAVTVGTGLHVARSDLLVGQNARPV